MAYYWENRLTHFVRRHVVETLALLYLVPLLWGGLVPFDFTTEIAAKTPMSRWWGLPVAPAYFPDMAGNVAVYIPLGVLAGAALRRCGLSWLGSMLLTIVGGVGLSYLTEWSQIYSPSRISSAADWVCNSIGTCVGVLVLAASGTIRAAGRALGRSFWRSLNAELRQRPSGVATKGWALVLLLAALVPFDVTVSADRLYRSLRDVCWTPFERTAQLSTVVHGYEGADQAIAEYITQRERWQVRLDWGWQFAGYALLAILTSRYLAAHCRVGGIGNAGWTIAFTGLLAVICSLAQLAITSRTVDVTDVLAALAGALTGWALAPTIVRWWTADEAVFVDEMPPRRARLLTALLIGWGVLLIARELAPFAPNLGTASIARQVRALEVLPFRTYQLARLPVAVDDLLNKAARFAGLGMLLTAWQLGRGRPLSRQNAGRLTAQVTGVVVVLEVMQIGLPSRTPALVDCLVAGVGTWSGIMAIRLAHLHMATLMARAEARRVIYDVEFGPGPAPVEPSPTGLRSLARRGRGRPRGSTTKTEGKE